MPASLADARKRIAAANGSIKAFKADADAFFAASPYAVVTEDDPTTGLHIDVLRFTKPLPDPLVIQAAQAVEHLRSALDLACSAVAKRHASKRHKSAYFPFGDSADGLERVIKGRCTDIPHEIVTVLRSLKPFPAGNKTLWAINETANTNKHDLLVPVGMVVGSVNYRKVIANAPFSLLTPTWDQAKNQMVITSYPDQRPRYEIEFTFHIVFNEVHSVAGEDALEVLRSMAAEAESVIAVIETEARRIGIIT